MGSFRESPHERKGSVSYTTSIHCYMSSSRNRQYSYMYPPPYSWMNIIVLRYVSSTIFHVHNFAWLIIHSLTLFMLEKAVEKIRMKEKAKYDTIWIFIVKLTLVGTANIAIWIDHLINKWHYCSSVFFINHFACP